MFLGFESFHKSLTLSSTLKFCRTFLFCLSHVYQLVVFSKLYEKYSLVRKFQIRILVTLGNRDVVTVHSVLPAKCYHTLQLLLQRSVFSLVSIHLAESN